MAKPSSRAQATRRSVSGTVLRKRTEPEVSAIAPWTSGVSFDDYSDAVLDPVSSLCTWSDL